MTFADSKKKLNENNKRRKTINILQKIPNIYVAFDQILDLVNILTNMSNKLRRVGTTWNKLQPAAIN